MRRGPLAHDDFFLAPPERALCKIDEAAFVLEQQGRLSVRATEALVRGLQNKKKNQKTDREKTPAIRDLETRFARSLGTKVIVRDAGNKGEIVIPYADLDMLDRIIAKIVR